MSKRKASPTLNHPDQIDFLSLLDGNHTVISVPETPMEEAGALNQKQKVKNWLNIAIKNSPFNRDQLANLISYEVGEEITEAQINTWTGSSRPNMLPACILPALTKILGTELVNNILGPAGCIVLERQEAKFARAGQLVFIAEAAKQQAYEMLNATPLFGDMNNG
jgi:hypothetical protein